MPYMADTSAMATNPTMTPMKTMTMRLEETGEALQLDVELPVVERGRRRELRVERSRLLADPEHLAGRTREQPGPGEWLGESLALDHLLTYSGEALAVHGVVRRLGSDPHRVGK